VENSFKTAAGKKCGSAMDKKHKQPLQRQMPLETCYPS